MQKGLQPNDYLIFFIYFVIVAGYGYWIYQRKKKAETSSNDFFLAEGSLTWWAIGASLIASNISAEQFIGMSGSGFKMGLAIATYEWMAAVTLIVVAVFFMPIYLKNRIFTMPQFLTKRYDERVSTLLTIFWLLLYVVVNLTSILYLGAIALVTIMDIKDIYFLGIDSKTWSMLALGLFAVIITLGGMKVIGYTDVIQVFFLILGGLATTYIATNLVSTNFNTTGVANGFGLMLQKANDHFHMIFKKDNSNFLDLPGLTVLLGGMWIVNLNYWGCNQYITQRALGADLKTARNGILFAAFLKLLMPVIVVMPGIAAFVLYQNGLFRQDMIDGGSLNPDRAYPVLLNLLPVGLKGLAFAALTAAIVASLAGKANSISTIFTLDIYRKFVKKDATEKELVRTGRLTVVVAMLIAILISPLLGIDKKGGFQYIQEYTGFVSPGIFAIFILGFFWKQATARAAFWTALATFPLSLFFKFLPGFADLSSLNALGFSVINHDPESSFYNRYEIPFLDRMGFVFLICVALMAVISLTDKSAKDNPKGLEVEASMFRVNTSFAIGAIVILAAITALYTIFW